VALGWLTNLEENVLGQNELVRYNRQLSIPYFGEEGQEKLKSSRVLIAGVGGLGCTSATLLTAVGAGHITLVDFDTIHLSDLNRQFLFWEEEIGEKKVSVAQKKLTRLNPEIEIVPVSKKITEDNVRDIIKDAQVIVDGLDNSATRLIVNSACVEERIPYIYGGVSRLRGMATTIIPGKTPCLACLNPEGVSGLGVLGPAPSLIANLQALEAIKLVIGYPLSLAGRLLLYNGDELKFRFYDIERNKNCPVCSSVSLD
jgi:molybdopterin/thiamine biosynthesis adenylyltransferase